MTSERTPCSSGFLDLSDGRKAKGHRKRALNTTCPAKRSHVTSVTGTASTSIRYLAVASSAAKQTVASAMSPIALRRSLAGTLF
jgi:hypothetical protein